MELKGSPVTEEVLVSAAKNVLLTVEEVRIWIDHLTTVLENRWRGAAKAAATQKARKQHQLQRGDQPEQQGGSKQPEQQGNRQTSTAPMQSKEYYSISSSTAEFWIECDLCDSWYCGACEGLSEEPEHLKCMFVKNVLARDVYNYICVSSIDIFQLGVKSPPLLVGIWEGYWGFVLKLFSRGWEILQGGKSNPLLKPLLPQRVGVGHNIDSCMEEVEKGMPLHWSPLYKNA